MSNFNALPKPTFKAAVAATAVAVQAGSCEVHGWVIQNGTAALAYVQVFNKAQGNVTVGTTLADYVIPVPASGQAVMPAGNVGFTHDIALTVACTLTPTGNGASLADVLMFTR